MRTKQLTNNVLMSSEREREREQKKWFYFVDFFISKTREVIQNQQK